MNGVSVPDDAALSGNKKSSGRLSFSCVIFVISGERSDTRTNQKEIIGVGLYQKLHINILTHMKIQ